LNLASAVAGPYLDVRVSGNGWSLAATTMKVVYSSNLFGSREEGFMQPKSGKRVIKAPTFPSQPGCTQMMDQMEGDLVRGRKASLETRVNVKWRGASD